MKLATTAALLVLVAFVTGYIHLNSTKNEINGIIPMGQIVYTSDLKPLPEECQKVGDDCWKKSISNGSIKIIKSGAMTFAVYRK